MTAHDYAKAQSTLGTDVVRMLPKNDCFYLQATKGLNAGKGQSSPAIISGFKSSNLIGRRLELRR